MKKQKFQALLVALCMLVSVIPAMTAPAAQATDPATQVIELVSKTGKKENAISASFDAGYDWQPNYDKSSLAVRNYYTNSSLADMNTGYTKIYLADAIIDFAALDFKVKADGYYNIDVTILDIDAPTYIAAASVKVDNTQLESVNQVADNDTTNPVHVENVGGMYLTEGIHTIVFTRTNNPGNYDYATGSMYFKNITLTSAEAPDVKSGYSKTVSLYDEQNRGSFKNMTIPSNDWEIDKDTTSETIYEDTMGGGNDRECELYASSSKIHMGDNEDVGFAFVVDADGYYDLSTKVLLYKYEWCAAVDIFVDDISVGSADTYLLGVADGTIKDVKLKERVYLEAGRHVFKLQQAGGGDRVLINSFTLTASKKQEAAEKTPFGYRYALVKKDTPDGDKYSLYVISAIDGVDGYKNAGFNLLINGNNKTEYTHDVYKSFTFTNSNDNRTIEVRPADFGLNDGYIYFVKYELTEDEVSKAMEITAFVTNNNDEIVSGKTVAVAASN